jgi:SP family sugar:H+ symporter-like MFS transporter
MELSVVPVFQSEIVPAPVRGMAVGSYQFSLMVSFSVIVADNNSNNIAWNLDHQLYL